MFVALKECRRLPYTFAFILSIFIITDVGAAVIAHRDTTDSVTGPGVGHGHHTGGDLPKRTIHVLISAEHISLSRASGHLCSKYYCRLVHTASLED